MYSTGNNPSYRCVVCVYSFCPLSFCPDVFACRAHVTDGQLRTEWRLFHLSSSSSLYSLAFLLFFNPKKRLLLHSSSLPLTRHLHSSSLLSLYLCMTSSVAGQPPEGNQTKSSGFSGPRAALMLNNRPGGNHPVLVPYSVPVPCPFGLSL